MNVHAYKRIAASAVVPSEENPRTHSQEQLEQLRRSIREFGFTNPLLVDEDNRLIAGHGRLQAAIAEGMTDLPSIVVSGLTDAQKRALVIADNQLALNAAWDDELLKLNLEVLQEEDFDLSLIGFTDKEIAAILANSTAEGKTDPDEIPETPSHPVSQVGDLWQLNRHRLLCGDSFDGENLKDLMDGRKADLVLTDPPYAIYGSSTGIAKDIADDKMVRPFFEKLGRTIADNLKNFGHLYVHCDWRSYATLWHGMKAARLSPKNCIVWDKGGGGLGASYANTHEFVAFFSRLPTQKAMSSGDQTGQRQVHKPNFFRCNRVTGRERQHNAAKPVELLTFLIENSSDRGNLVADFFAGSGSTLIAAEKNGRVCYSMEMEPRFVDVAIERWQAFTGKSAMLGDRTFAEVKAERHDAQSPRAERETTLGGGSLRSGGGSAPADRTASEPKPKDPPQALPTRTRSRKGQGQRTGRQELVPSGH